MSHVLTAHLGDLGAALVDDQLDPAMRNLVLLHMAGCARCRHEVEEQRLLKDRLRGLAEPGMPASLLSRLTALSEPRQPPAPGLDVARSVAVLPDADRATSPPRPVATGPVATGPGATGPGDGRGLGRSAILRDANRGRRLLAGAASLLLVGAGTAYAAAGYGQPGPPLQPVANVLSTSGAGGLTSPIPLNDPAFAAMTVSFGR